MSLLTIVQGACQRIGIAVPAAVIGSQDAQIVQLLALLNKEGKELATGASVGLSHDWQSLQIEASFTSVAVESQGALATIAPGFKFIINGTIWDRTRRLPAYGNMSPQEWQAYKSWGTASPFPKYRIRGGLLLLMPIPAAGDNYRFEYQSKNWCSDSTGATTRAAFTADTDIGILDEDWLMDGLVWRWKQAKGLDYAEDFATYQRDVQNAIVRDVERPTLNMGRNDASRTGVIVPIGNWNV
jgi:hypothetical protein